MIIRPLAALRTASAVLAVLLLVLIAAPPLSASSPADPPEPQPPAVSPGTEVPIDWLSAVQAEIVRSEYFVTWQEQTCLQDLPAAYQAPNRAQGLRTYFAPTGPVLIARELPDGVAEPPWRLGLRLEAWGRDGALHEATAAVLEAQENRIEYRRGSLAERYRNDEQGLALGLRLDAVPDGDRGAPLRVVLATEGGLTTTSDEDGVTFAGAEGAVVRLGALAAHDAEGRALDATLTLQGDRVVLAVDDAGAVYPVEATLVATGIQSTAGLPTSPTWNILWTEPGARFGFSVSTAGDVNKDGNSDIIVGAPRYDGGQTDEGRALVYLGHGGGLAPTYVWSKEGDQTGAQFGHSVGTAGDVNGDGFADVIVGAPNYDYPEVDEGGAWVYQGSYAGPHTVSDFFAQSDQAGALLGDSVAFSGNVNGDDYADIIVGARSYNAGAVGEGIALVWHGSSAGVNGGVDGTYANAAWRAESNQTQGALGSSVATAGDVNADGYADVIVGGFQYGADDAGAAWVWHGSSSGVNDDVNGTPANAEWTASGASAAAHFGLAVATAGDVNGDGYADVIVGAPHFSNGLDQEGAAYLYLGSGSGVVDSPDSTDVGNSAYAWFGYSVACAGDVNGDGYADVVVGAPLYTDDLTEQGLAFLWYGSADGISLTRDWWAEGTVVNGQYGTSVATAGDMDGDGYSDLIVGAPGADATSSAAYVYYGGPDKPSATPNWSKRSNQEGAAFGWSVGTAGDVNGDGYAEIIVGAPHWDSGEADEGGAWIYRGAAGGLLSTPYWYKQGDKAGAVFGWSVGTAGDVDGDGYSDVVVGAPLWSDNSDQPAEGGAWVYPGSSTGVSSTPAWSKDSDQSGARFGYAVAAAGDVNDDGYGDVIVGAPYMQYGEADEGVAWLYLGSAAGLDTRPARHFQSDTPGALLGHSVAGAGDVDADGYSDVIIGAPEWEDDLTNEGLALLFRGNGQGLESSASWRMQSNVAGAQMGYAVAGAGDVNGDGYADVVVGAPYWASVGHFSQGKVWVFHGAPAGLRTSYAWVSSAGEDYALYGWAVGTAGDVNGDGYADVLIGAPQMTGSGAAESGLAFLFSGGPEGVSVSSAWRGQGDATLVGYGISAGTAGDVNGDGYADLVVGEPGYDEAFADEGRTLVTYGNGRSGASLAVRQQTVGSTPLAVLGHSDSNGFRPTLSRRNPFGRGQMAAYFQVARLRTGFTGQSLRWEGYWTDAPLGGNVSLYARDLDWGTTYHWRLRFAYRPATTPWMPASRWVTMPWNGWNEEDLRTPGSRIYVPAVMRNE